MRLHSLNNMRTIRYILVFFNFVLALAVMIVGLCIFISGMELALLLPEEVKVAIEYLTTLVVLFAVAGAGVFVFALIGCFGVLRRSPSMIRMYAAMLLTALLIKLAVSLYVHCNWGELMDDMKQHMELVYNNYTHDSKHRRWIDNFQKGMSCCGSTSTSVPWSALHVPPPASCYLYHPFDNSYDKEPYSVACVPKTITFLENVLLEETYTRLTTLANNTVIAALLAVLCLYTTLQA